MSLSVTIDQYQAADALDWAKEHCPSYITNDGLSMYIAPGSNKKEMLKSPWEVKYNFYFSDESEALMFQLRWA